MTGVVVPKGSVYFNTSSGLAEPGGVLDRLTQALDTRSAYQGTLAGYGPALRDAGIPVAQPQGILSTLLSGIGIGGQQPQPQQASPQLPTSSPIDRSGAPAPTMGGSAPPAQPTSMASAAPTGDALIPAIGALAQKHGLDPMTVLRAVRSESGVNPGAIGDGGSSFGLLQLHYGGMAPGPNSGVGMGDDYTKATGRDARDPANAMDALDYALGRVSKEGWGAFHGAAKAGIGQWDGIGSAPAQMAAYAPSGGSDGPSLRPPTAAGSASATPMPIATSSPGTRQMPQPPAPDVAGAQGAPGASASGGQVPAGAVLGPLMANGAARDQGGQAWQMYRQAAANGGGRGGLTLPAGMSPQSLAAMIAEPTTMQAGLQIFERSLYPQIQAYKPGDYLTRGGQPMGQVPNPLQHVVVGKNAYGEDVYGTFDQNSGRLVPDAQPSQGAGFAPTPSGTPAAAGPGGAGTTNEAYLASLPGPLGAQVKAIAEGRMKMPPVSSRSPIAARLPSMVLQYKPDYDQTSSDARFDTKKNFTDGPASVAINSGNTAIQHAADLSDAAEALGNSRYPLVNKIGQALGTETGGNVAGKEFQGALNDFTDEVVRFYRNSGGTEADINAVKASLDPSQSPDQLRAGIQQQARLMAGKTNAYQNQWHVGMGPDEPDFPIFSKETRAALARIEARKPSTSSYPPRDAAGGAGGGQTPLPTAAPAGSIPTIADPAQAQSLPPGTRFRTPDGQLRVRH